MSNDCVIVPDFGGFMAHHIDARKDDGDGSFLPPIRSIGFNPKLKLNDSLLAQSYVEAYDISYPEAVMRIEDEVRELRQRIDADGKYEFTDIGTICLNADGNYEFTPCEAGIISPKLYGLGSFRMKTLQEIKAAMQAKLMATAGGDERQPQAVDGQQTESRRDRHSARIIAIWRNVAVACIAIIFFLLLPSPLVNSTQMAGNHIDTGLLDRIMPKDITTGQEKVSEAVRGMESKKPMVEKTLPEKAAASKEKEPAVKESPTEGFAIVLASHVSRKNADAYVDDLHKRGYREAFVSRNGHVKVLMGHYRTREEAAKVLNNLNDTKEFAEAWITNIKF